MTNDDLTNETEIATAPAEDQVFEEVAASVEDGQAITPASQMISIPSGVISAGIGDTTDATDTPIKLTSGTRNFRPHTRRTYTNISVFDPTAKYIKSIIKNDRRLINFQATQFARDAVNDPESVRKLTIAGVICNRDLPSLWEARVAWSAENQPRWCVLIGDKHARMPSPTEIVTVSHRRPDDNVNYRRALVLISADNILGIGIRYRGTDSVFYYRVVSVCPWPAEAAEAPSNETLCGINLELVAIRTKNVTTGETSMWPEEPFDKLTERGLTRMFGQVIDNFQAPANTPCYIEYFRRGKKKDGGFFIPEDIDYNIYDVKEPDDMILYLRQRLAEARAAFGEEGRPFSKYISCNALYERENTDTGDGDVGAYPNYSVTIFVPSLDETRYPSFAVRTEFPANKTPFSIIDEPALALGSTRSACLERMEEYPGGQTILLKTRL